MRNLEIVVILGFCFILAMLYVIAGRVEEIIELLKEKRDGEN